MTGRSCTEIVDAEAIRLVPCECPQVSRRDFICCFTAQTGSVHVDLLVPSNRHRVVNGPVVQFSVHQLSGDERNVTIGGVQLELCRMPIDAVAIVFETCAVCGCHTYVLVFRCQGEHIRIGGSHRTLKGKIHCGNRRPLLRIVTGLHKHLRRMVIGSVSTQHVDHHVTFEGFLQLHLQIMISVTYLIVPIRVPKSVGIPVYQILQVPALVPVAGITAQLPRLTNEGEAQFLICPHTHSNQHCQATPDYSQLHISSFRYFLLLMVNFSLQNYGFFVYFPKLPPVVSLISTLSGGNPSVLQHFLVPNDIEAWIQLVCIAGILLHPFPIDGVDGLRGLLALHF